MKPLNKINILIIIFLCTGIQSIAQKKEDIIGYWKSCDEDDNMVVKIDLDSNGIPTGHLIGFQKDDGTWEKSKPKKGIKVMYNFTYNGDLKWNKGKIYDPVTKRTYRGVVKLQSKNIIKATGYWAFLWDDILYKRIKLDEKNKPNAY